MPVPISPTVKQVLEEELGQVETSRNLRLGISERRPAGESLIGLAFSGGGIRSATFNLGILQALSCSRLLRSFDYVSTVSGGGYIGGWLMAWMHHQGIGIQQVEEKLSASPDSPSESADPPEVHFLREYSNYLTPRKGLLGADFWSFAASYLRNTLLNQAILVLALLSLLMLPRSFVYLLHLLETAEESMQGRFSDTVQPYMQSQYFALGLGLVFGFLAVVLIGMNLVSVDPRRKRRDCWFTHQWAVQAFIVVPLFLSGALFTYGLGQFFTDWHIVEYPLYRAPLLGICLYFGLWAVALAVRSIVRALIKTTGNGGPKVWVLLTTAAVTGAISGYLFVPFSRMLIPAGAAPGTTFSKWHVMTFGTPVAIAMMLIAGVLHIGLIGRGMTDAHREWWGRLGGWVVIYGFCWFFLFLISVYFPAAMGDLLNWEGQHHPSHPLTTTGILAWIVSTAYGVYFGKSDRSGEPKLDVSFREKLLHYMARVAPYVFIIGLLLGLSLLAAVISHWIKGPSCVTGLDPPTLAVPSDLCFHPGVPLTCVLLFVAAVVLSWRVDINEFSIHYLYRNRLVRCYLGASVPNRVAQPFTGFSDADNFPLSTLQIPKESTDPKDARPLPILNTSLNVVRGKELALQTRKARSFAFTPIYGGFTRQQPEKKAWQSFFGPTKKAGCLLPGYPNGITLGTSIAISGAAASPNMGSYSEPPLAFLMTLFDVRLGWWIGNPAGEKWKWGSPAIGFYWLLRELLGSTNDDSDFVYLSDGGHFENLALYELVRRRCKLIVASDVSCDSTRGFGDLHNAIERCRTDFGVEIVLDDLSPLRPRTDSTSAGALHSKAHFAVGKIRYNPASEQEDGAIIYIKPSLVDGDPDDVLAYAGTNKSFPNDTTANQWFDEAHFENYRALGQAAGASAAHAIDAGIRRALNR
jgi:predicted acylesterase/phospholipase RssA